MTNVKLLEEKIKQSGLKKAYIAEKIGVSPNTFTALLNNKTEFKARQIRDICLVLGIKDNTEIMSIFLLKMVHKKQQKGEYMEIVSDWHESKENPGYRSRILKHGNCTIEILRPILTKAEREKIENHVRAVAESTLYNYYRRKEQQNGEHNHN